MPTNIINIDGTGGGAFSDQAGSDQITFGANAATLSAGQGTDTVSAGSGALLIDATGDRNGISVRGGAGDLTFADGAGPASITGGTGRTTILPSNGQITVVAGGGPIDIYSKDSWSGYYELTPAPSDTLTVAFDGASGEVFVLDQAAGKTLVIGQGFAFYQNDPGILLSDWTQPPVTIDGLTNATRTGGSPDPFTTTDATPVVTGTAPPNTAVIVTSDSGAALAAPVTSDAQGRWQAALVSLPYGTTDVVASAAIDPDLPPFETSLASAVHVLPASPSIDGFSDSTGAHTGSGTTADRQPRLTGTAPAGATVQIFAGGTLLGDAAVSGAAWSYQPAAPLPEGSYRLTAVATDPASGTSSAASAPLALDIVLGAPSADGFTDATGFLTGGDTLDHRPAISGTAPEGTSVSVYDDGVLIGAASVSGGAWSFTPAADLADGAHVITAIAKDTATGAVSAASAPLALRVDPSAPAIEALTGASGAHRSGDSVADPALVLSGSADPGVVVTVSDGATVLGAATVSGSAWTFALPSALAYGAHSLTAAATDPSDGLVSAGSAAFAFVKTPPAPVVSGLSAATDTGASSTDGITSDADPTIQGAAVPGDSLSVFDGGTLLGTAVADRTGAWSLTPAAPLAYGAHVITAQDTAANGMAESGQSAPKTVVILAPPPVITMLDGSGGTAPLPGAVTADTRPTVSGKGQAGSSIALYDGSVLIGQSGAIGADGAWSVSASRDLSAGLHNLTAVARDAAGHASETSSTLSLIVNPPPAASGGVDRFAVAIRASIASLVGQGSGGDNAVIYKQPGQTSDAAAKGVSGLSIDDSTAGQTIHVPATTEFVSDIASGPVTVIGADGVPQAVVASKGDLTYDAGDGSGVLLAEGSSGRTVLFGSHARSSHLVAATGAADDVLVAGDGDVSLSGGGGSNIFWLGAGQAQVDAAGVDTIVGGSGAETVTGGSDTTAAAGAHSTLLFGGSGKLTFINISGGSTVSGGSGSSTLLGGQGSALFFGGKSGGNVIVGGAGPSTLIGGGDGDLLWAGKTGGDVLVAHGDRATLGGGSSTGDNLYFGGSGRNVIAAGLGNDTISGGDGQSTIFAGAGRDLVFAAKQGGVIDAGSGNATLVGSAGAELYGFSDGRAGGDILIYNFRPGTDHLTFQGYAAASIETSLQNQTEVDGSAHVVLSDGTRITFSGLSHVSADNLV